MKCYNRINKSCYINVFVKPFQTTHYAFNQGLVSRHKLDVTHMVALLDSRQFLKKRKRKKQACSASRCGLPEYWEPNICVKKNGEHPAPYACSTPHMNFCHILLRWRNHAISLMFHLYACMNKERMLHAYHVQDL